MIQFLVTTYGGEYEDKWESHVGVCTTRELAEELKQKIIRSHAKPTKISEDRWSEMYDAVLESDLEMDDDFIQVMYSLFPEYSKEDIDQAYRVYESYDDFAGVSIKEIELFETISDINFDAIIY